MFEPGVKGWFGVAGSFASVSTFLPCLCQGPEITDELVRVLRRRLDEATLDVITVMLVRNCKLTPADVEVSSLPHSSIRPWQRHRHRDSLSPNLLIQLRLPFPLSAVHPAPRKSALRGAASGPAHLLQALASCPGLVPAAEPAHLPALSQVHRQQQPEPLPGECSPISLYTHVHPGLPAPHTHPLTV